MHEKQIFGKRKEKFEGLFKNHILRKHFLSLLFFLAVLLPALVGCGISGTYENTTPNSRTGWEVLTFNRDGTVLINRGKFVSEFSQDGSKIKIKMPIGTVIGEIKDNSIIFKNLPFVPGEHIFAKAGTTPNNTSSNDTQPSKIAKDLLPSGLNKNDIAKQFAGTWRYSSKEHLNNDGTTTSSSYLTKFTLRPTKMDHGTYEKIGERDYMMARGTWSLWDETENPDGTYDVKLTLASDVNNPDLDTVQTEHLRGLTKNKAHYTYKTIIYDTAVQSDWTLTRDPPLKEQRAQELAAEQRAKEMAEQRAKEMAEQRAKEIVEQRAREITETNQILIGTWGRVAADDRFWNSSKNLLDDKNELAVFQANNQISLLGNVGTYTVTSKSEIKVDFQEGDSQGNKNLTSNIKIDGDSLVIETLGNSGTTFRKIPKHQVIGNDFINELEKEFSTSQIYDQEIYFCNSPIGQKVLWEEMDRNPDYDPSSLFDEASAIESHRLDIPATELLLICWKAKAQTEIMAPIKISKDNSVISVNSKSIIESCVTSDARVKRLLPSICEKKLNETSDKETVLNTRYDIRETGIFFEESPENSAFVEFALGPSQAKKQLLLLLKRKLSALLADDLDSIEQDLRKEVAAIKYPSLSEKISIQENELATAALCLLAEEIKERNSCSKDIVELGNALVDFNNSRVWRSKDGQKVEGKIFLIKNDLVTFLIGDKLISAPRADFHPTSERMLQLLEKKALSFAKSLNDEVDAGRLFLDIYVTEDNNVYIAHSATNRQDKKLYEKKPPKAYE